tara:strand:- start:819 stop:1022 length:204 start_codon:yes stop_codon:yes gene_type:complete
MTLKQIRTYAANSLKKKLALRMEHDRILGEIANYTAALKGSSFKTYNQSRIDTLTVNLHEVEAEMKL